MTKKAKGGFKLVLDIFIEAAIIFFVVYVFVMGGAKLQGNATNYSMYLSE